jgi:hypothetical protein
MYRRIGVIFLILTLLMATACSSTAAASERIAEIMGEERITEAAIEPDDRSAAGNEFGRETTLSRRPVEKYLRSGRVPPLLHPN